jgi:hypothetical protein
MIFNRANSTVRADSTRGPALCCEPLESRLLYYALSGSQWAGHDISYSFVPDGTTLSSGYTSALFAHLDAQHPTEVWQHEFARALQTWAQYSPLNFHLVSDDGSPFGAEGSSQGDPRFGDIRLSGRPIGSALAFGWYPSTMTSGGDIYLSTNYQYEIGSVVDLYSLFLHEIGHSLGLDHSTVPGAIMTSATSRVATDLGADDIAGIQAIYGARPHDAFDASARNDSFASATRLSADASGLILANADLTGSADADHYSVTVPTGSDGTLTVSIDARGLSLLAPAVRVYDAAGNLVASASAGESYGTMATVSLNGLVAGQKYVIVVDGASDDMFGAGAYRLNARFGMGPSPIPTPDPIPNPQPDPDPDPTPAVEPDRFESNDVLTNASDLGRTTGFNQADLTVHSAADQDYYRFVPAKNGTYVVSAVGCQGLGLRLTLLDSGQRVLASGTAVTLNLTAGQVYYINLTDSAGACGDYDLSLVKANSGGGGGKRGFMRAPHTAGDGLYLDDSERGWSVLARPQPASASAPLLMDELE